jgi:hypothetical protein
MDVGSEVAASMFPTKITTIGGAKTNGHTNGTNGVDGTSTYPKLEAVDIGPIGYLSFLLSN